MRMCVYWNVSVCVAYVDMNVDVWVNGNVDVYMLVGVAVDINRFGLLCCFVFYCVDALCCC